MAKHKESNSTALSFHERGPLDPMGSAAWLPWEEVKKKHSWIQYHRDQWDTAPNIHLEKVNLLGTP